MQVGLPQSMRFFANWIVIVLLWGGLGTSIVLLIKLKLLEGRTARINLKSLRSAFWVLPWFVLLASISMMDLLTMMDFGYFVKDVVKFFMNLFVGILFLTFLRKLWKAITIDPR